MFSTFFALNELKFSQTRFLRFGKKRVPSQAQEKQAKFHPDRNIFAKLIKTEVKVMVLYLAVIKQLHPKSS